MNVKHIPQPVSLTMEITLAGTRVALAQAERIKQDAQAMIDAHNNAEAARRNGNGTKDNNNIHGRPS